MRRASARRWERTQPMPPMGLGYDEGVTRRLCPSRHNYPVCRTGCTRRRGAGRCKPGHRHQEFLAFLRSIDKAVPAELDVHCIVDNYSSHPKVKAWLGRSTLAHAFHAHLQFLIESSRTLFLDHHRQGHPSRLLHSGQGTGFQKINHFVAHYNQNRKPITWTATADSILVRLNRTL
ncbi:putative transposase [Nitrosospira sp. Nsp11]|nr:putative transposase [Nitrosospira sp. Nsp18]SHL99682.1 putative transposase [Nitrosospira sp. Nsp11]